VKLPRVVALAISLFVAQAAYADDVAKPDAAPSKRSAEASLADGRLEYERGDYAAAVHTLVPLLYPSVTLASEEAVVEAHRLLALSYLLQKIKDEEARAKEAERKRRAEAERIFIDRTVEHHSRIIATVPFGVGQLQNGQPTKAALFLSSELVFGAASLAGYLALEQKYPVDSTTNRRYFPIGQEGTARALLGLQLGAGIAFWATLAWGLIDAHVLYRREVVKTREVAQPPPKAITVRPGGLGLQGAF
jgi:hypothetical protein